MFSKINKQNEKEIKVITREKQIEILANIARAIDKGETNFTKEEWEYIHEAIIAKSFSLQFGGRNE